MNIAEKFGKRHADVLRSIENLECSEKFTQRNFAHTPYINEQNGQEYTKCLMTKDGFSFLVFGYTGKEAAKFKEDYIAEFNCMEAELNKPKLVLPQNFVEALRLLATAEEVKQLLLEQNADKEKQLTLQAPKVALYDTAMNAGNNFTMMHVAKTLGIGRNKLFDFLRDKKVLMKNNLPYEAYVTRGYFEVRQYTITHFTTGLENKTQTLVTPKGMAWIHSLLTTQQEAN